MRKIREKMIDGRGHQLLLSIPDENGYGTCRSCPRQFVAGARRIVFSYNPNDVDHAYNESRPIFIHADECEPYEDGNISRRPSRKFGKKSHLWVGDNRAGQQVTFTKRSKYPNLRFCS